jgi:hypothetical protein
VCLPSGTLSQDRTGAYMDAFDIVVLNDGDMSVVLDMLHTIMSQ